MLPSTPKKASKHFENQESAAPGALQRQPATPEATEQLEKASRALISLRLVRIFKDYKLTTSLINMVTLKDTGTLPRLQQQPRQLLQQQPVITELPASFCRSARGSFRPSAIDCVAFVCYICILVLVLGNGLLLLAYGPPEWPYVRGGDKSDSSRLQIHTRVTPDPPWSPNAW